MSARRSAQARRERKAARRCRNCRSKAVATTEYDDAFLHICQDCSFPEREVKP